MAERERVWKVTLVMVDFRDKNLTFRSANRPGPKRSGFSLIGSTGLREARCEEYFWPHL